MRFFATFLIIFGLFFASAIYGQPELYINEFMADNDNIIADPQGDYDDWIEIYNPVDMNVDLGGFFLTDDLSDPQQWAFPDTFIEAGGFLLVWADDDEGDEGLHTNFKLGADGEAIGLYQPSGEGIDSIVFGEQTTDISYGRLPDGGETWQFFDMPTPGSMNLSTPELNHDVPSPMVLSLVGNYPNPFNPSTTIHYQLSRPADVTVSIYNLMGEQVCIFHSGLQPSGVHQVQWDGSNQQGQSVVSGIYVGRVSTKTENHMMKMVLLK